MSVARVQKAFEAALALYAADYRVSVAWDNTTFNPADAQGEYYFVPSLLPASDMSTSIQNSMRVLTGFFQVLVVAKPGAGSQRFIEAAVALGEHMERVGMPDPIGHTRGLPADDSVCVSGNVSVGVAYDGENGYTIPVSIPYFFS